MRKILISFLLTITAAFAFSSTQPDNINAPLTESQINDRIERAKAEAQRQIDAGIIKGAVFAATNIPPTPVGFQRIHPQKIPMTANSRFDIASVTKTFTAAACALLICDGKISPDAPFTKYLPKSSLGKDCDITVRDLAMHVGGFDNSKPYCSPDMEVFYRELYNLRPVRPRLSAFEYSCANFVLLGKIVNSVANSDLDSFAKKRIWKPLGMGRTLWNPPGDGPDEVEHWFPNRPAGQRNDPVAFNFPFPVGNAGCFSTANDLMLFASDLLSKKTFPKKYYDLLLTPAFDKNGDRRSFGWDMSPRTRPEGLSDKTILHSGWTGQTICVDPENNFAAVVLTSRTGNHGEAMKGRAKIISILFGK